MSLLNRSQEEYNGRRRLIQFGRYRDGSKVRVSFRHITPQQFVENAVVISCIYREETDECYVTSVDIIFLLEFFVGTRFGVEEKNRIRRNLEHFKPVTVAKNRGANDAFFQLIMGFPNPKPRNIEKDVKVFKWKMLAGALERIVAKYVSPTPWCASLSWR